MKTKGGQPVHPPTLGPDLARMVWLVNVQRDSVDLDNHLFGNKTEAKIFIVPPVFEGSFLERLEFIVAPGFISDIFKDGITPIVEALP